MAGGRTANKGQNGVVTESYAVLFIRRTSADRTAIQTKFCLNEDDTVQFIIGYKGERYFPYRYDEKYRSSTSCEGRYKYKYLRRLENEGKISWN